MDKQALYTTKEVKGSVTIFFVYSIVIIMSLIFSITELARMNAEKLYLQMASSISIDSMLSMYHRKLYEYYHIFALEMRDEEGLKKEYIDFLNPHFKESVYGEEVEIDNWMKAHIDKEDIILNYQNLIMDNNIEKEIIEYMKLDLVGKAVEYLGSKQNINEESDINLFEEALQKLNESFSRKNIYATIHERYFNFTSSLKKLAKNANNIKKSINEVNKYINEYKTISTSGTTDSIKNVKKSIDKIKNKIDTISTSIKGYKEALETFRDDIDKNLNKYTNDLRSGKYDFDEDTINFIEDEFGKFIDFAEKEDEVLKKIEELEKSINLDKLAFSEMQNDLNEYVYEIENLEAEKKELARLTGDDKDPVAMEAVNENLSSVREEAREYVKEFVKPYISEMFYENIDFNIEPSETEEERALESILNLGENMILRQVLTAEEIDKLSSENVQYKNYSIEKNTNLLYKILVNEYRFKDFNYYNKNLLDEVTKSGSTKLEVERMLKGKNSDINNLEEVVKEILAIRIAMNVLHIYRTSELRERARNLAFVTFGSVSPIIQEIMFILIITCWGTCQSIKDVRKLLHNKRVPFIPTDKSFDFDVSDIFRFGRGDVSVLNNDDEDENALFNMNYKDYLRLLLLKSDGRKMNEYMVSIIQKNMEEEENTFLINNMLYSFSSTNTFKSSHMLTEMLFLRPKDIVLDSSYKIKINAYSDYGNLK